MPRLVLIGLVGGFFSALFGVGGGIVLVPLLLLLARYAERAAMATSLAAIGITALAGTIGYGVAGHVQPVEAALVGLPAAVGAVSGTALQQRLRGRALSLAFAALLAGIAVLLLVT
ncbi:MAG TPA: sulfite exporter TauE/SafE family protein [Gaiellaceae bacterium]|nr:sulfite exporter TauE/SafE family protein [Gaiellaceae bacterium]